MRQNSPAKRRRGLLFESEISWFVLAGTMDVVMTYLLLRFSAEGRTSSPFVESNPIARWILHQWGMTGLVLFKFAMIGIVVTIAEIIGRSRPKLARGLLIVGTAVVVGVVIYSLRLLIIHT